MSIIQNLVNKTFGVKAVTESYTGLIPDYERSYIVVPPFGFSLGGTVYKPSTSGACIKRFNFDSSSWANSFVQTISQPNIVAVLEDYAIEYAATLTSLSLDNLEIIGGSFIVISCGISSDLSYPSLRFIGDQFWMGYPDTTDLSDTAKLISFENLEYVGGNFQLYDVKASGVNFKNLKSVKSLYIGVLDSTGYGQPDIDFDFSSLEYIDGDFTVGGAIDSITTASFPVLKAIRGSFKPIGNNAKLTTFNLPQLKYVGNNFTPENSTTHTAINVPALEYIQGTFNPTNCTSITSLNLASLKYLGIVPQTGLNTFTLVGVNGRIAPVTMTGLTSLTFPAIIELGNYSTTSIYLTSTNVPNLTTFTLGSTLKMVTRGVTISAPLNQASVDNVLVRLAALDGTNGTTAYSSKTVTINGLSSAPSATGLTAKDVLVARGCTVTVNS